MGLITAQINDKQKHLLEKLKELEAHGDGQMTITIKNGKIDHVEATAGAPDDDPFKDLKITLLG